MPFARLVSGGIVAHRPSELPNDHHDDVGKGAEFTRRVQNDRLPMSRRRPSSAVRLSPREFFEIARYVLRCVAFGRPLFSSEMLEKEAEIHKEFMNK